jgi:hypothetical protein
MLLATALRSMARLVLFCALVVVGAACIERHDTNPLDGDWRVDRTLRTVPAGCPRLVLPPLAMTLHPGYEPAIDVGPRQYNGDNAIMGSHIIFTTSEFAFSGTSDMLIIGHDLETQTSDPRLIGTAAAQGDGANLGCHWAIDAVATRTSR